MNAKSVGSKGNGGGGAGEDYILIRDEKANGTPGGDLTGGVWQTRDFNTIVVNQGSHASLAANQITLAAGTYKVRARSPVFHCSGNKAKLRNITDGSDLIIGGNAYSPTTTGDQGNSAVVGRITLAAPKILELQHRSVNTRLGNGLGIVSSFGVIEVYSTIEFWREA